jgi:hypothetical protein
VSHPAVYFCYRLSPQNPWNRRWSVDCFTVLDKKNYNKCVYTRCWKGGRHLYIPTPSVKILLWFKYKYMGQFTDFPPSTLPTFSFWTNWTFFNTLPSGHVERRDCSPMRCWRVTHFYVFLLDVLHMRLSAGLAHLSLQGYRQSDPGCWVSSYKSTDQSRPPIFRTIRLQQRVHSFRYALFFPSVAIMDLHRNVRKRMIFCMSYMRIHVLMSLIIVTMKVWTVTLTSQEIVHVNNCNLLLVQRPHNFHTHFSSHLSRQFL